MISSFKIAAYLDEAGDNPELACETLNRNDIPYIALRNAYGRNICESSDDICKKLKKLFTSNNISPVCIISNLSVEQQPTDKQIQRIFDIASYYDAEAVCISLDLEQIMSPETVDFILAITGFAIKNAVLPIIEPCAGFRQPNDYIDNLVEFLKQRQEWKVLYDPVKLILKKKIDPFKCYWPYIKDRAHAVDVRDYIVGRGFKPPGLGDSKIMDVLLSNFNGWLFIEPNLGKKYGKAIGKSQTFDLAWQCLIDNYDQLKI